MTVADNQDLLERAGELKGQLVAFAEQTRRVARHLDGHPPARPTTQSSPTRAG